ncbi:hypothetical protein [Paenibacillus xylanexedens]|uniref:hypothetical protein n=1 Tax=Paenibacillus xylanexedens TaxID=528191 RepID=UPI0021B50662|nr:hypothetical protein [Paenibacillus xylanexedens]
METLEYLKILVLWAKENFQYKSQRDVILKEEAELVVMDADWCEKFRELGLY